ncbi:MAG TPA: HXXEE domain-containing protein [Gemmatimonadaceae bacterium]|nr:HXXEE domain-containing protein [Gemmatimonadaceae bacterium]
MPLSIIRWLPLMAVALHLIEEFVWPGGFAEWFRWYWSESASSVTGRFLFRINALFVAMAVVAGLLGFSRYGVAMWLLVASIAATNGLFHLWAVARTSRYSPGVVTGCLVYIPLAVFGFRYFWQRGWATIDVVVQAALIGPAYLLFSAWNHRRRARAMAIRTPKVPD